MSKMSNRQVCRKCFSDTEKVSDESEPRIWYDWMTGRKAPWSYELEITSVMAHPIRSLDMCFYHNKFNSERW